MIKIAVTVDKIFIGYINSSLYFNYPQYAQQILKLVPGYSGFVLSVKGTDIITDFQIENVDAAFLENVDAAFLENGRFMGGLPPSFETNRIYLTNNSEIYNKILRYYNNKNILNAIVRDELSEFPTLNFQLDNNPNDLEYSTDNDPEPFTDDMNKFYDMPIPKFRHLKLELPAVRDASHYVIYDRVYDHDLTRLEILLIINDIYNKPLTHNEILVLNENSPEELQNEETLYDFIRRG